MRFLMRRSRPKVLPRRDNLLVHALHKQFLDDTVDHFTAALRADDSGESNSDTGLASRRFSNDTKPVEVLFG